MIGIWTHRDNAIEITNTALKHYKVHRQIVFKKLKLAQKAARKQKRMAEVKGFFGTLKAVIGDFLPFQEEQENDLWGEITTLFSSKAVYEDHLFQIEELLDKMPEDTQVIFSRLVEKDKSLSKLHKNLDRAAYRTAKKKIAEVQTHKNPLTGLSAEDYEQDMLRYLKDMLFNEDSEQTM